MTSEADNIIGLYQRHAEAWLKARGSKLVEEPWLYRFRQLLPPVASVLDLGCGSGMPIARYFVGHGISVSGVDSAPEMVTQFHVNLAGQRAMVGDMRTISLGQRFDGLLAWDSFFHLRHDDQRAMFAVFRAHARPHAALMFTTGTSLGEAIGMLEGEPLYHASLDGAEYRSLLNEHGFEVVSQVNEDPSCEGRSVWLAQRQ